MYTYEVRLFPESAKARNGLNLGETQKDIDKIVTEFNSVAKHASNPKKILSAEIENGNAIKVILQSKMWLDFPIKALRGFISTLSKLSPYSELMTSSGRLFKGESVFLEETEVSPALRVDNDMSDEEILIAVTKLFFRENRDNRGKIEKIKKILEEV